MSTTDEAILDRSDDEDETVGDGDGAGSGVVIASPGSDSVMMDDLAKDLANVNVASSNPAMHQMLTRINKHLISLSLATDSLSVQQRSLLAAERKGKVAEAVRGLTNPMSVRALQHNYKVLHHVEDLLEVFRPKGQDLVITDVAVASDIISAATSVLIEVSKLLRKETESHKVAHTSHLGWKVIQELERKELAAEQVDLSPILPDHEVRAAEKSLMSYTIDMEKALSFSQKRGGAEEGLLAAAAGLLDPGVLGPVRRASLQGSTQAELRRLASPQRVAVTDVAVHTL